MNTEGCTSDEFLKDNYLYATDLHIHNKVITKNTVKQNNVKQKHC